MKKFLSITLAAVLAASALASCAVSPTADVSSASDGLADKAWLENRLGGIPGNVTVGTAEELGLDMSGFEDDGYIIRTQNGEVTVCGATADGLDRAVRKYAKMIKYDLPMNDVTYHEGYRIERLTVAGRDISEYTVVYTHTEDPYENHSVPLKAPESVSPASYLNGYGQAHSPAPARYYYGRTVGNGEFAAFEFVRLISLATGIILPMTDLSTGAAMPEHYIKFETDERDEAENEFGTNGYSYKVENGDITFRGSGIANGCANGVYDFVERVLGWAGMTYGDATLAESDHIDVSEGLEKTGHMMFDHFMEAHCDLGEALSTMRYVGYHGYLYHACHGMLNHNFAEGAQDMDLGEPCMTDEWVYEIIRDNVDAYLQSRIASGERVGIEITYVDVSQGDNNDFCGCPDCRALYKKDGGAVSGSWIQLANHLSEDLDEKYPGLYYLVFAYSEEKQPPKVTRPNEHVSVTFCVDGSCFNHAIDSGLCFEGPFVGEGYRNQTYAEWIREWTRICDRVSVWYYAIDTGFQQHDIFRVLFDDVKFFKSLGVKGFYMEGEYNGMGTGRLNHELLPELQWDPDMTWEEYCALAEEFVKRDYGEDAYPAYREAQELIRTSTLREGCRTCWSWSIEKKFVWLFADYEYVGAHMEKVLAGLDEMIADAPSRLTEIRGERLSLCILYEGIVGRYFAALESGDRTEMERLTELYALFHKRGADCGYDMNAFPIGCDGTRRISPDLDEEGQVWANGLFVQPDVKKFAK